MPLVAPRQPAASFIPDNETSETDLRTRAKIPGYEGNTEGKPYDMVSVGWARHQDMMFNEWCQEPAVS